MKARAISTILITLLFAASKSVYAQKCPVKVGDVAQYFDAEAVYNEFMSFNPAKSEYETALEYQNRIEGIITREELNTPHLLRVKSYPEFLTYMAEQSEFIIQRYAWDNTRAPWNDVFGTHGVYDGELLDKNPWGIDVGIEDFVHGMGLFQVKRGEEVYMAHNAADLSVEMIDVEWDVYSVFDKIMDSYGDEIWKCETYSGRYDDICSVRLSMPRELAPAFKEGLNAGIMVTPKAPLAATGTNREMRTFGRVRNIITNYKVIIADIHCAVLSGPDGKIVKTIDSAL